MDDVNIEKKRFYNEKTLVLVLVLLLLLYVYWAYSVEYDFPYGLEINLNMKFWKSLSSVGYLIYLHIFRMHPIQSQSYSSGQRSMKEPLPNGPSLIRLFIPILAHINVSIPRTESRR